MSLHVVLYLTHVCLPALAILLVYLDAVFDNIRVDTLNQLVEDVAL